MHAVCGCCGVFTVWAACGKCVHSILDVLREEERVTGVKPTETVLLNLHQCFKDRQRSLVCTPALGGSVGMNGHGVTDHSSPW